MALLYSDENFSIPVVRVLRSLGHDVRTAVEDGRGNKKISDDSVLARSTELGRIVLTCDRDHYHHLHEDTNGNHAGIITCTFDRNVNEWANRIHEVLQANPDMRGQLRRVTMPSRLPPRSTESPS